MLLKPDVDVDPEVDPDADGDPDGDADVAVVLDELASDPPQALNKSIKATAAAVERE